MWNLETEKIPHPVDNREHSDRPKGYDNPNIRQQPLMLSYHFSLPQLRSFLDSVASSSATMSDTSNSRSVTLAAIAGVTLSVL